MPNFKSHLAIGGIVGFAAYGTIYYVKKCTDSRTRFDLEKALTWTAIGAAAACLPDFLEPATSPHHRGFFHSIAILLVLGWWVISLPIAVTAVGVIGVVAVLGYISHLVADSLTPRSLPWI